MRLYFFVEGQTEEAYAGTVLREHLAQFGVMVCGPILAATRRRHGKVHRGGGRHYAPMRNDLLRLMRQERGPDVRFTTMLDLYALYADFPGTEQANRLRHLPHERVKVLEAAMASDLADPRLLPHIQLHEFEAILFSQPDAFSLFYEDAEKRVARLVKSAGALIDAPELIDDGQHTAPSKRVGEVFPDYEDSKPDAPVAIASGIELDVIRQKCPHFHRWLAALEQLGTS